MWVSWVGSSKSMLITAFCTCHSHRSLSSRELVDSRFKYSFFYSPFPNRHSALSQPDVKKNVRARVTERGDDGEEGKIVNSRASVRNVVIRGNIIIICLRLFSFSMSLFLVSHWLLRNLWLDPHSLKMAAHKPSRRSHQPHEWRLQSQTQFSRGFCFNFVFLCTFICHHKKKAPERKKNFVYVVHATRCIHCAVELKLRS